MSLGTYHLPFNRLVAWIDSWAVSNPSVSVLVQHGVSSSAAHAANVEMLAHDELIETYTRAKVLVLQGGAGGVMDAGAVGVVPIVVPRVPELGEVIDDHQIQFATLLQQYHLIHLAQSQEMLHRLITRALQGDLCIQRRQQHQVERVDTVISRLQTLNASRLAGSDRWRVVRRASQLVQPRLRLPGTGQASQTDRVLPLIM